MVEGSIPPLLWQNNNRFSRKQYLYVGESISVIRGSSYPFSQKRRMDDGETSLGKGDPIMDFHVMMEPHYEEGLISYSHRLKGQVRDDMKLLALLCKSHPDFQNIKAFVGISHLARLAEEYGFTVYPVEKYITKKIYKARCFYKVETLHRGRSGIFDNTYKNFPDPMVAAITPRRLSQLYL